MEFLPEDNKDKLRMKALIGPKKSSPTRLEPEVQQQFWARARPNQEFSKYYI